MASIPKRVEDRLAAGVKKYQLILAVAKSRDVNESDTLWILNDILEVDEAALSPASGGEGSFAPPVPITGEPGAGVAGDQSTVNT